MRGNQTPGRNNVERIGVNAVERAFLSLDWLFREQTVSDYGIDAQVEPIDKDAPTGRLVALQIKSGESWFVEKTSVGFVYRGDLRHLEYWSKHALPVVLVLYNTALEKAWWCAVTDDAIHRTNKGWFMVVPHTRVLDRSSDTALRILALPEYWRQKELSRAAERLSGSISGRTKVPSILNALQLADESVDLIFPFVDLRLFALILGCAHRVRVRVRVRVRMITLPESAHELISMRHLHQSLDTRTADFLHSKMVVVDRALAIVGSANLVVSAWIGDFSETSLATSEKAEVDSMAQQFAEAWERCSPCGQR